MSFSSYKHLNFLLAIHTCVRTFFIILHEILDFFFFTTNRFSYKKQNHSEITKKQKSNTWKVKKLRYSDGR